MVGRTANKRINNTILAPRAVALWLIENTTLTFAQIAEFCNFSEMTIKLMADGVIEGHLMPVNPIANGTLTKEEIRSREKDGGRLTRATSVYEELGLKRKVKSHSHSRLQKRNKPEAILYLLERYPELSDSQIRRLVRTTDGLVAEIRKKTYKNIQDLTAKDPVLLGLCTQSKIEDQVKKATNEKTKGVKTTKKDKKTTRKINVNGVKK